MGLGRRYGFSAAAASVATLLKILLSGAGADTPFQMFFLPVAAASWFGGMGPALFCSVSCALASNFLFSSPQHAPALNTEVVFKTILFLSEAAAVAWLSRDRRQSNRSAAENRLFQDATLRAVGDAVITTNLRGAD